ncbi:MAG: hypothetical protein FD127_956 [Acidimicrobiaceae bacterium]|nr:MAG: hypothetical protein FD127_956 [Acidimicrobiaceae bacterium]
MRRDQSHAEAGDHGLLDRLVARYLHAPREPQAAALEHLFGQQARSGTDLANQERLLGQPRQRDRALVRQRMFGRGDHQVRMIAEHRRVEVERGRRATHDDEVDVVPFELADRLLTVADVQLDVDSGVGTPERSEDLRREVLGCADRAEHDASAGATLERVDDPRASGQLGLDPCRRVDQFATHISSPQPVVGALEQRQARGSLEQAQLL